MNNDDYKEALFYAASISCADECRGVKVKIAVLCISVFQPVREILLQNCSKTSCWFSV